MKHAGSSGSRTVSGGGADLRWCLLNKSQVEVSKVWSAEGRLVLDFDDGQITVEFLYLQDTPVVVARLDWLSPDATRNARDFLMRFEDLPILLEHAAKVLRHSAEHFGADKPEPGT